MGLADGMAWEREFGEWDTPPEKPRKLSTSRMTIDVEFLAGTTLEQAFQEAKEKCVKWDVAYVHFNFNGRSVSIGANCNVEESVKAFQESWKTKPNFAVYN